MKLATVALAPLDTPSSPSSASSRLPFTFAIDGDRLFIPQPLYSFLAKERAVRGPFLIVLLANLAMPSRDFKRVFSPGASEADFCAERAWFYAALAMNGIPPGVLFPPPSPRPALSIDGWVDFPNALPSIGVPTL